MSRRAIPPGKRCVWRRRRCSCPHRACRLTGLRVFASDVTDACRCPAPSREPQDERGVSDLRCVRRVLAVPRKIVVLALAAAAAVVGTTLAVRLLAGVGTAERAPNDISVEQSPVPPRLGPGAAVPEGEQ